MPELTNLSPNTSANYKVYNASRPGIGKDVAHHSSPTARGSCTYSWSNLSYTVDVKKGEKNLTGKKTILHNVTGRCAPGELTAVMGPSGSGKTTLLDLLADRISSGLVEGTISLNGEKRDVKTFRAVASYVAQEDSLLGSFTVLETLQMAARLSLPSTISQETIDERVQHVVDDMGLRVCEHAMVGDIFRKGISGGQKRRLSIAIELLSDPAVLLLDEPTSGLDSASTHKVMQFVQRLCQEGKTVICTIHQPPSLVYDMFSNVAILTAGQTVYFGPRADVLDHFSSLGYSCPPYRDPAEHFISLANTDFPGHGDVALLISGYASSAVAARIADAITTDANKPHDAMDVAVEPASPSPLRQFVVLLARNLLNNLRNPGIFWIRMAMYTVLSLLMGTMYLSTNKLLEAADVVLLLVYSNVFLVFMSIAVLPFFIDQRAVFLRERANSGLNVFSYVLATFLATLPGIFLIALVSTLLVWSLAGLESYGIFLATVFLSLVAAEAMMHLIAACVVHFIVGMALGAGIFGMFILCMGLFVPRSAIPDYWIWCHYLGFLSYGFEALMYNQFGGSDELDAKAVLTRYGMQDVSLTTDFGVILANAVAFELLFAAVLYKFHTGRR